MEKIIELLWDNKVFQVVFIVAILLIIVMVIVFFIQYNIDRCKGRHAKFLWFEVNGVQQIGHEKEEVTINNPLPVNIDAKNVNTGVNYGEIGDKYTGLKQREMTEEDVSFLSSEIKTFSEKYKNKLNFSHITIGYPGCKETTYLANQVYYLLVKMGYKRIEMVSLQTYGVIDKKFGVSNAPDNSLMVEIYPPNNVE